VSALAAGDVAVTLEGAAILNGVDLSVERGEWLGLIGPNGAGKTTLLRALAGLVPYRGSVRIFGDEVVGLSRREIALRVAFVSQTPIIPLDAQVADYVLLGRTPHIAYAGSPGAADEDAAHTALEELELGPFASRRLGSLSGGELQRAVLARALAQGAEIMLLDEPTTALDVGAQQEVLELVSTLRDRSGLTVVSATHDLTLAGQYADRLLLVNGGRDVATGSAEDVLTEPLLAEHYGASVRVLSGGDGIAVLPVRTRDRG
jgi:iron complex transport system ATP-binding protein